MIMENDIMVSVNIVTYNQEKYISKAIEGVLMQKCNFNIELIIANDCSTDDTDRIIKDIINTHHKASCIKYTNHEMNIGMQPNGIYAIRQSKGKYIALCDGDDYWSDPLKLQKQIDFMEKNVDVSITCHNVERLDYLSKKVNHIEYFNNNKFLDNEEIISNGGKITPLLSYVFKTELLTKAPKWVFSSPIGDLSMILYLMLKGRVFYFKDLMAVYRENIPNSWTAMRMTSGLKKKITFRVKLMVFIQNYNRYTKFRYSKNLKDLYRSNNIFKDYALNLIAHIYRLVIKVLG